jgi:hypothetical protein
MFLEFGQTADHLNVRFVHFIVFAIENKLVKKKELEPLKLLLDYWTTGKTPADANAAKSAKPTAYPKRSPRSKTLRLKRSRPNASDRAQATSTSSSQSVGGVGGEPRVRLFSISEALTLLAPNDPVCSKCNVNSLFFLGVGPFLHVPSALVQLRLTGSGILLRFSKCSLLPLTLDPCPISCFVFAVGGHK